ncbi:MAG: DegT/DnrJ/EryC1/StrS family aminotransferase [Nitrospirota bacterium]|nr:DegT/DnrJ/EryC1/StrS family aminotransferase [Nitrospirota bacterium]
MLPPAGGPIPYRLIFASLRQSMKAATTEQSDVLARRLTTGIGPSHWIFTNSGRSALSLVLMALRTRRPQCDEVVIPAYTSYSVPAAVVRAGLRVRLCDIEPHTLGLDPNALARTLNARTLCIVPHHLFGLPCRIREICEIAAASGIPVVEDVAQGLGIRCDGRNGGMFGEASIFSISRGKNIPGAGGGLIGLSDEALAQACRTLLQSETENASQAVGLKGAIEASLMAWFIRPSWYWLPASLPFLQLGASRFDPTFSVSPMTRFQQALLAHLLPTAQTLQDGRQARAIRLRQALHGAKVEALWPRETDTGAYLRLPILLPTHGIRARLLSELTRRGLGSTEGYPLPLSKVSTLRSFLSQPDLEYPVADGISQRLMTLPTHVWVTDEDIEEITEMVTQCVS